VAALAIISTALIAVATWFVTQSQARTATRRNMRINYLLDAYRRLDHAGNRERPQATRPDLEAAISDIFLLGSPQQARLAEDFARTLAAHHNADITPLLQDLRQSLRAELLLERLPAASYVSLRFDIDGDRVSEQWRIWRETAQATRQSLTTELDGYDLPADLGDAAPANAPSPRDSLSPSAIVAASVQLVEHELRTLLAGSTSENLTALNLAQLASRALQLGLIDTKLADTLGGLTVMRLLAATGQDRLTPTHADEFASLAATATYLLDIASRSKNNTTQTPISTDNP